MSDVITKYIEASKYSLKTITYVLEENIQFNDNNLWSSKEEFNKIIDEVINIYFDNYYLYPENDFNKINTYINFNARISRKLKTILLAIIDFYEKNNNLNVLKEKEESILYLTILIYTSLLLYNSKFIDIDNPKGIEKRINSIIDNFKKINFKSTRNLDDIINKIKDVVEKNNKFRKNLDDLVTRESHNAYINFSKGSKYYKVLYEYDLDDLDDYDGKDISIVIRKMNILKEFIIMSFELSYFTIFKTFELGYDYKFIIPIAKDDLTDELIDEMYSNKNEKIINNINFMVKLTEIDGDYEFLNHMKKKNVNIFIEVDENKESENYNMFMSAKDIVVEEEFLTLNDKYSEIWKDMEINFVIKNMGDKITEKELLNIK